MSSFEQKYKEWLHDHIAREANHRRSEILTKGLGHGTYEFLRSVWFPAVKSFDHLYPEWEVRDFNNGYRYIDLAYMPGNVKGAIEVQGYGSHARDLDVRRFKDLCWRHSLLALDDWLLLHVAYLSIIEEPKRCQQLVLAFIGKFISPVVPANLSWLESETIRFARRELRPVVASQLAEHLRITDQHARRILRKLVEQELLFVVNEKQRYRSFSLRTE